MKFSWKTLKKPFFVLAPMEGAADTVFRQVVASCGKPDVFVTEFTSVEGLLSKGSKHVGRRLQFTETERPLIAQIWGTKPESFYKASLIIQTMGFDGIDINMGCPVRDVVKHGACSGLIRTPNLAKEIIDATKRGAGELPVSVKTRIGFSEIQIDEWIGFVLEQKPAALTVHLRTTKEMSEVPAHWEEARRVTDLKNTISPDTILIGNGDIDSMADGKFNIKNSGMDGMMIGRGVFHNPYVFNESVDFHSMTKEEKVKLLISHLDLFTKTWGTTKNYSSLKRYYKIYIQSFDGAAEFRQKLMETETIEEAYKLLE